MESRVSLAPPVMETAVSKAFLPNCSSRAFMASVALDLARERPVTGVGGGAFEMEYLRKDGSRGKALFAEWRLEEKEAVVYAISIAPEPHPA